MNILVYRYNSICEPDMIAAFSGAGLRVIQEDREMTEKRLTASERISLVEGHLKSEQLLFVFSVNFFPDIAEICHIYRVPYLGWTVDSPVPELFSRAIAYPTTHLFLFDYEQYLRFSVHNPSNIHYLPLGVNPERFDKAISSIDPVDVVKYSHDISFVGSLYSEKNPMRTVSGLSDYSLGYINALVEASLKLYGANMIESALTPSVIEDIRHHTDRFFSLADPIEACDGYVAAHLFVGTQVTEVERIRTLNALAKHFRVDLYTHSDTSGLKNVQVHGGVNSLNVMPKILHLSRINLNMTSKPILSGLPLRIFDIMGCGGFLMTNYQAEIPEYFEIGTDLETYSSPEELIDKCSFYLEHEEARRRIAESGYRKVKNYHTYFHRVLKIVKTLT